MPKALPANPNLEQLRKQAKDLRNAHKDGLDAAAERIGAHLKKWTGQPTEDILQAPFTLRNAQQVIAREHGFTSWQKLLGHWNTIGTIANRDHFDDADLVPAEIVSLIPQRTRGQLSSFMVLLRSEDKRAVIISIGNFEGNALTMGIRRIIPPRPLAHRLLQDLLDQSDGRLTRLVIHSLNQEVFYARLFGQRDGKTLSFDCRPSDGMVLATQHNAPIYLTQELLDEAGKPWAEMEHLLEQNAADQQTKDRKALTVDAPYYQGEFRQQGKNLHTTLVINPWLAALGGQIFLSTKEGQTPVPIAPDTASGTVHQLQGKGLPQGAQRGDLYYRIQIESFLDEAPLNGQAALSLLELEPYPLQATNAIDAIKHGHLKARQLPQTLQVRILQADLEHFLQQRT